ncbi:MAG: dicarboxylate/amino acid:cation symporter [Chlamydiota bacterium]
MNTLRSQSVLFSILFAIATAFVLQCFSEYIPDSALGVFFPCIEFVGSGFLRLLTVLVIPLVCSSIISSIAKLGSELDLGKMGAKTALFYFGTTIVALIIGMSLVNLLKPGVGYDLHGMEHAALQKGLEKEFTVQYFLENLLPKNLFLALAEGKMLPLILFSVVTGAALTKLDNAHKTPLISFFDAIFHLMLQLSSMLLKALPLGVYCLSVNAFSTLGKASLTPLLLFSLTVLLGLGIFMFLFLPIILRFYAKMDPIAYMKAMSPALFTAFTTSSSSASIPITIECIEKKVGVSKKIARLIVPLGISINLSGSALYECVAAVFVAQAYGVDLSIGTQFIVVFLALFTSMGVAGIPAGSLVATIIIMQFLGLPPEGIGLFIAVERFMDMARTTANIYGDGACAVLVAASEGETAFLEKTTKPQFS